MSGVEKGGQKLYRVNILHYIRYTVGTRKENLRSGMDTHVPIIHPINDHHAWGWACQHWYVGHGRQEHKHRQIIGYYKASTMCSGLIIYSFGIILMLVSNLSFCLQLTGTEIVVKSLTPSTQEYLTSMTSMQIIGYGNIDSSFQHHISASYLVSKTYFCLKLPGTVCVVSSLTSVDTNIILYNIT